MTKQYKDLIDVLDDAGLISSVNHPNGSSDRVPDFDKISEITGLKRGTVKTSLAPKAGLPRWVKLLVYIGKNK